MDDDEGFVSNEYNRYERCVCSPEQLMRMRPPKNTDPGLLSDSDLEDSDTRSGSDYFVSQQGNYFYLAFFCYPFVRPLCRFKFLVFFCILLVFMAFFTFR